MKLDLEKVSLVSAVLLLALAAALVARGGGFGIAGLSWDTQLTISRSNLRIGPYTVVPGDRIRSVNSRPVHRDADLRGVLRQLEADEIWLEIERADYEVAVPLTPEAIEADDIPAVLEGPYEVVRIDDMAVEADMNLALMASWMRVNGDRPAVFTVSVPDYSFEGGALRVKRPGPIVPLVLLLFALAMVALTHWRGRSEVMTRPREHWHLLATALAAGGVLLAYLSWHDGFMADPVLLPLALLSLGLARPLSLFVHQARRGRLEGPAATYFRLGAGLPAGIYAMAALYGWTRTLSSPLDGFVFDQLRVLVLVGAAATALYHLADLALLAYERPVRGTIDPPWIACVIATLFIVSALIDLSTDPGAFVLSGFVPHLAGLIGVQWLGDMALLPRRVAPAELAPRDWEGPQVADLLVDARAALGLQAPAFACRFDRGSVLLSLEEPRPDGDGPPPPPELRPESLHERLEGLLELLDAEGGMIPRYKTVRGSDESDDDPFDGLAEAVGVELVLPLAAGESAPPTAARVRIYLVGRVDDDDVRGGPLPSHVPSAEAIETWRRRFASYPETWSRLQALAAEHALNYNARHGAVGGEGADPPSRPALTEAQRALLYYASRDGGRMYPLEEPGLVGADELTELKPFTRGRGPMLVTGPIGSGREFTARLVHARSRVADADSGPGTGQDDGEVQQARPFIVHDCAELPDALVLAELTGEAEVPGRLDAAQGGTLCMRDLSRLSEQTQAEVLAIARDADVRVILIEDADEPLDSGDLGTALRRAVDEAILHRPPLAERPDAVERAARYYLHRAALRLSRVVTDFDEAAITWLREQAWPANFHSLALCVLEGVITAEGETVELDDLTPNPEQVALDADDLSKVIENVEREAVLRALERSDGNKSQAARLLGMKRTTYVRKLSKYAPDH